MSLRVAAISPSGEEFNLRGSEAGDLRIDLSSNGNIIPIKRFREDFNASLYLENNWDITTGSAQTTNITANSSQSDLIVALGTTANAITIIKSHKVFSVPLATQFTFKISQRIANQSIYFELVDVDNGDNKLSILFDGTLDTSAKILSQNNAASVGATAIITESTDSYKHISLDLGVNLASIESSICDADTFINPRIYKKTRFIPDPNKLYKIQIRGVNGATAPESSTTLYIDCIAA